MKVNELFADKRKLDLIKNNFPEESVELVKEYLPKILKNFNERRFIEFLELVKEREAKHIITGTMLWRLTPEGSDFWNKIFLKLERKQ